MGKDGDECGAKKCGCGDDVNKPKGKDPCSEPSKPGFGKTPCKEPRRKKPNCHESQKQFKPDPPCGENPPCGGGKDTTCQSSYEDFGKSECVEKPTKKSGNDCGDAYRKYLHERNGDCSKVSDVTEQNPCQQTQSRSDPCSNSAKHTLEQECKEIKPTDKVKMCPETSQSKCGPCSGADKKSPENCTSSKSHSQEKSESSTLYSKFKACCKDIAKGIKKQSSHSKCSSVGESSLKKEVCTGISSPIGALPCPPQTEKAAGYPQPCCSQKVTCPQTKLPSWKDFFPLDARNKKLNECIEKYSKIDPSQVISKCAQFASVTLDTSDKCLEQMRKAQKRCMQGVNKYKAAKGSETTRKNTWMMLSPRSRQMAHRWAPSAGLYLATAAVAGVYVTEWKEVLKYVPLYRGLAKDGATS